MLNKASCRHQIDGLEKRHSWLLDEIEVKDMSSEDVWIFPCGEWLSLYAGDGIVKRRLRAHLKELEQVGEWNSHQTRAAFVRDVVVFVTLNDIMGFVFH